MVGIRDIASHLNISVASVSRALNGHPYVNEEVRRKVVEAARVLGYRPRQSGRSLRTGLSNTVGFMIETHPTNKQTVDNFLMSILDGVQNAMLREGLTLVVLPCSANQNPVEYVRGIIKRRFIDGMIITATRPNDGRVSLMKKEGLPFVTLGRTGFKQTHSWVDLDFETFAQEAVARLHSYGHRRIAIILPEQDLNFAKITAASYKLAVNNLGLEVDPKFVCRTTLDHIGGFSACEKLLSMELAPTAAILIHEALAPGVYQSLRRNRLEPGIDFGLISAKDGTDLGLSPSLTRFKFDTLKISEILAQALVSEIKPYSEKHSPRYTQNLVGFEIWEGESENKI